ncbi:MAG: LPS export ABC transporter permease LptF [Desulfobacteraceae bacterium]|nr:MAG: LPS export ABC transporter permease LptF [Desulfobacteraceae bacterium]
MIIQRYIFKEFLPSSGISLVFFSFIFIMSQLPDITNYVVNFQIGMSTVVLLLLYSMPYFLQFTIPMSVMIGVLLTFLRMSGDMEILALKAGGVHVYRFLPPVLIFGLIGTLLTAYMAIFALPSGRKQSKLLLYEVAAAHVDIALKPRQFVDISKDVIMYVHEIDNATKVLSDIFIEDRRSAKLKATVIAPEGRLFFNPGHAAANLRLFNGTIHQVDLVEHRANTIHFKSYDLSLDLNRSNETLKKDGEHVQEMSLSKLRHKIRSAQQKDGAYFKALKEWHRKFSLPAASLVMALLAMPLGIRARSSQRAYGVGLGLFFFLLYYVMLSVGWVLGESGVYPPVMGMWVPNAVILAAGLVMLVRTAQEKPLLLPRMPSWLRRLQLRNPWIQHRSNSQPEQKQ